MDSVLMINDFESKLLEESSKGLPNFERNFCKYLQQIVTNASRYNHFKTGKHNPITFNNELYLRSLLKKTQPDAENQTGLLIRIEELVSFFVDECLDNFLHISPCFANYCLHLLIRDVHDGLDLNLPSKTCLSIGKIANFLGRSLEKYKNPCDATMCSLKVSYFCNNSQELCLDIVKKKYEKDFKEKFNELINSILQYPENSNHKQLEEMCVKMQVFIITNYGLGSPINEVLLKQCRQSLNSVLGKGDLQKYVLRKRYHRLEYLQKLAATVAGIVIFNNQGPQGDKENMRLIFDDLKMALTNTKESLDEGVKRAIFLRLKGTEVIEKLIEIDVKRKNLNCLRPLAHIREINKYIALFEVYRNVLEKAKETFGKTSYLIEVAQKKFDCVVGKINEILKYRTAIESEIIFPHFVYLSEIWTSLVLYFNHLVEINKIKDHIDNILNENLENKYNKLVEELSDKSKYAKYPINYTFEELMNLNKECESKFNMLKIKPFIKDYCALTLALTGGFLIPSQLDKKLCENLDLYFGFANMEYAKFAEHNFKDFINVFRNCFPISTDLILLFQLDNEIIQLDFDSLQQKEEKTNSLETQTENVLCLKENYINWSWNSWDFHRQTIHLANLRKKQTHSSQTKLSYGIRHAQNYCNRRTNNGTQK